MGKILHLDEHRARDFAVAAAKIHALDVRPGSTDRRGDVGVKAAAIVAFEGEPNEEALTFRFLPIDLEAALGLVRKRTFQCDGNAITIRRLPKTVSRMDCVALIVAGSAIAGR